MAEEPFEGEQPSPQTTVPPTDPPQVTNIPGGNRELCESTHDVKAVNSLEPQLEFRRILAVAMINNGFHDDGKNKPAVWAHILQSFTRQILTNYSLGNSPLYAYRWLGSKWKLSTVRHKNIPN